MHIVRIPKIIQFGENALSEAEYPKNALVVTTAPRELSGKWLDKLGIQDYMVYDKVKPEPSIEDLVYFGTITIPCETSIFFDTYSVIESAALPYATTKIFL